MLDSSATILTWIRLVTPAAGLGVGLLLTNSIWAHHPTTAEVGVIAAIVVFCLHAMIARYVRSRQM
jgi:hypothetical protein